MKNNNFLMKQMPKHVRRHYEQEHSASQISCVTFHQDTNCPCVEIELDEFDRKDSWQWQESSKDDDGKTWNGWALVNTSNIYDEEEVPGTVTA